MRKQYTAEQREKLIAEVRTTGEGVGVVAKRLGVTSSSAYLWMKAATVSATASAPEFVRVVSSRPRSLRLESANRSETFMHVDPPTSVIKKTHRATQGRYRRGAASVALSTPK
jgi:transposase-like protein